MRGKGGGELDRFYCIEYKRQGVWDFYGLGSHARESARGGEGMRVEELGKRMVGKVCGCREQLVVEKHPRCFPSLSHAHSVDPLGANSTPYFLFMPAFHETHAQSDFNLSGFMNT